MKTVSMIFKRIDSLFELIKFSTNFRKDLAELLNIYMGHVEAIFPDKDSESDYVKNRIKRQIENIESCIELYYLGLHSQAFEILKSEMIGEDGLLENIGVLTIDKTSNSLPTYFYRARFFPDKMGKTYQDMFHIPFTLRGKVSTQRFSAPGYPCLYLGASVYACWEELHRPCYDDLVFSGFKVKRKFKLLDLRILKEGECSNLLDFLLRLPLIIACSFPVRNPQDTFKPEYIIPQLLIEIIIERNQQIPSDKTILELPLGVIYTSTHRYGDFAYGKEFQQNIALPVVEFGNKDYCKVLASLFSITHPTCNEYEEVKSIQPYFFAAPPTNSDELHKYNYSLSKFAFLEGKLKTKETYELNIN